MDQTPPSTARAGPEQHACLGMDQTPPSTAHALPSTIQHLCGLSGAGGAGPWWLQKPRRRQLSACALDRGTGGAGPGLMQKPRRRQPSACALDRGTGGAGPGLMQKPRRRQPSACAVDRGAGCADLGGWAAKAPPSTAQCLRGRPRGGLCRPWWLGCKSPAVDSPVPARSTAGRVVPTLVAGLQKPRRRQPSAWGADGAPPSTAQCLGGRWCPAVDRAVTGRSTAGTGGWCRTAVAAQTSRDRHRDRQTSLAGPVLGPRPFSHLPASVRIFDK